ncbi:MAG: hypothetical protein EOL97_15105, partial [Spirochaetia bacterium]|nr:hypothetical protein [Spirochaetia bacterium]
MMNLVEFFEDIKKGIEPIKKIKFLVSWLFPDVKVCNNLTDTQALIIKKIVFDEVKRFCLSAYTRFGKTQTIGICVCLQLLMYRNKKIVFIGPTKDQASLIREYVAELMVGSRDNLLINLSDIEVKDKKEKVKAEARRDKMTFKNGNQYYILSANNNKGGISAMGKGGDILYIDEGTLISRDSFAKIMRMLGDDAEDSRFIELFNPWDTNTATYDHFISPRFETMQIGYDIGLKEGRTTQDFIDEQKELMTSLEFQVLYESKFPDEAEDGLFKVKSINNSEDIIFNFKDEIKRIEDSLKEWKNKTESEIIKLRKDLEDYSYIISCDPADKGLDYSVIYEGIRKENDYEILDVFSEDKTEQMKLVGNIITRVEKVREVFNDVKISIIIDKNGIGTGAESRLKEIIDEKSLKNVYVVGAMYGGKAIKDKLFQNLKAENFFRLNDL